MSARGADEGRQQLDDNRRSQICTHEISGLGFVTNAANLKIDEATDAVEFGVFSRDRDRVRIRVTSGYRSLTAGLLTDLRGGDGQYARARADVEKTFAMKKCFDRFQTESRRLVSAGAKCHAGIYADDDPVSTGSSSDRITRLC